jgi:poly [ADP-ribose] polymerase
MEREGEEEGKKTHSFISVEKESYFLFWLKNREFQEMRPRKLLWHGSRLCNYVGILNQGLRIAPKEAPTSGYMFGMFSLSLNLIQFQLFLNMNSSSHLFLWLGKGIYFADIFVKSANFCFCNPENNIVIFSFSLSLSLIVSFLRSHYHYHSLIFTYS